MRKISKMSGVLQGNCCETYRDIPQTREMFFSECVQQLLINKRNI